MSGENEQGGRGVRRALDAVAVMIVLGGGAFLLATPVSVLRGARRPSIPEPRVVHGPGGEAQVEFDPDELETAFARAGLPAPPDLNGADPVPLSILLKGARSWTETARADHLGTMAQVYQALAEHEAALACFIAARHIAPEVERWWYGEGAEWQALGYRDEALVALRRARELNPDYATTHARIGSLLLEAGDLDGAERSYEEVRRLTPGRSLGHVGLGRVALARGANEAAARHLRNATKATPNDYLARRLLARALSALGRVEEARREETVAAHLPEYAGWLAFDVRLLAARKLARTQSHLIDEMRTAAQRNAYDELARHAEQLVERRPSDYAHLGNLASAYRRLGRLDEADALVQRALDLKPDSAALHCIAAEIVFTRRDFDATHRALDAAVSRDPDHPRIYDLRGRALYLEGRFEEAAAALRRAVSLAPRAPGPRLALAITLKQVGKTEEAAVVLRELLEIDPRNAAARQQLEALGG